MTTRRLILCTTGLALTLFAGSANAHVSGVVFCDANHNGHPDTGEGIAGVTVLRCDNVTAITDADGYYYFASAPPYVPCNVSVVVGSVPGPCNIPECATTITLTEDGPPPNVYPAYSDINFCFTPPGGCTPVSSCITSGFNGTSINPNNCIWFSANLSATGIPATGATVHFNNSQVTINGVSYNVPGGAITFSPSATCATTVFDGAQWNTTVPLGGSDEILLSGFAFKPTADLKAASVTWCGDFSADIPGISIKWKWGAAVYTCICGADYNALNVKPTHSNACSYQNSDHAGTPEAVKACVIGGARGGGGSNFTGSWSGTAGAGLCP